MGWLRVAILRLRSLLRHESALEDTQAELAYHIERQIEENIARGMSPQEARRAARDEFGSLPQFTEEVSQASGLGWMHDFMQDLRYGLRMLRKSPAFAAVAILTLALGIGACTAIFSLVNAVLIRSLPYGDASRLVYLFTPIPRLHLPDEIFGPSYADFFDLQRQNHSYSRMTIFAQSTYSLVAQGSAQRIGAAQVDADFFPVFESAPELGRAIQREDTQPGHDNVLLISHALWQSIFGGSYDVLTKSLLLDGKSYRIIGVMPPAFGYPDVNELAYGNAQIRTTDVWLPLALTPQQQANRGLADGNVVARLRPGVSLAQAQAELSAIVAQLDPMHPVDWRGATALVKPFREIATGPVRSLMWLLLGAVFLVLFIACSNAANLLLARASSRTHELGVRATLGAGRSRIVRQMLTESLLLGLAGGATGTALAYIFLRALLRLDPGNIPRLNEATLDLRVLFFTLGVSLFTSILFGLLPALTTSRVHLVEFLKSGGNRGVVGTHHRLRDGLVIVEVGLAIVLLTGAGLLLRSYLKLASVNPGFSQTTVTMSLKLDSRYSRLEDRQSFFKDLINKLNATPGIQSAGAINYLPLSNSESLSPFTVDGYANQKNQLVESRTVTPAYFSAMGTPLMEGRFFNESASGKTAPVVIINQSFAHRYFAGRDPIGKHTSSGIVIGVVGDVKHFSLEEASPPQIFRPFWQDVNANSAYIVVRSTLPPANVVAAVRSIVKSIDPTVAVADIHTMGELISKANAKRSFQTTLLALFAGIALFLALVGIYGLLSYAVKQRTAEIGIRMSLGATSGMVQRMVLSEGGVLLIVGLVLGVVGAIFTTRLIQGLLFGVAPDDPLTVVGVSAVMALVGVAACWVPARRAARIDPQAAMRRK